MDIPPYHVCHALTKENETLTTKYKKLTRKYKELQKQMLDLQEQVTRFQIEKEYNVLNATAPGIKRPVPAKKDVSNESKDISTEKLLVLHNKLLKQFDKETKLTSNQTKKLRKLETENEKLKDDLFGTEQQIDFLKKQVSDKDNQLQVVTSKAKLSSTPKHDYKNQLLSATKERNKLLAENKKLREELKGLDRGFFEELEDMKYALQQSAKLNVEYEKAIKRLCRKYGRTYQSAFVSSAQKDSKVSENIPKEMHVARCTPTKRGSNNRPSYQSMFASSAKKDGKTLENTQKKIQGRRYTRKKRRSSHQSKSSISSGL